MKRAGVFGLLGLALLAFVPRPARAPSANGNKPGWTPRR